MEWEAGGGERWWSETQNDNKPLKNNLSQSAGNAKFILVEKLYIFSSPFGKVVI